MTVSHPGPTYRLGTKRGILPTASGQLEPRDILDVLEQACARSVGGVALRTIAANSNQVLNYLSRAELENMVREQHRLQGESLRASGVQTVR